MWDTYCTLYSDELHKARRLSWWKGFYPLTDSGENWLLSLREALELYERHGEGNPQPESEFPSESHYQRDVRTHVMSMCCVL